PSAAVRGWTTVQHHAQWVLDRQVGEHGDDSNDQQIERGACDRSEPTGTDRARHATEHQVVREVQRQRGFTPELCWARSEQACEEASAVRESEEERREQDHDEPLLAVRWKEREADDQGRGSRKRDALP